MGKKSSQQHYRFIKVCNKMHTSLTNGTYIRLISVPDRLQAF